ncbi:hypothetical protein AB1Y20_006357 [Prymnesium parvum]|uniref:EndoU domain-containing protein n=1 Tax=Prymnesium parvum TaxID=97485 RepID=A0AB34J234_PRYPA
MAALPAFIRLAIAKLAAAEESLCDDDPQTDYAELLVFARGFSQHLKSVGAAAAPELKAAISASLAPVWDVRADVAGPELSVDALRRALETLLADVLPAEDPPAEPVDESIAPAGLAEMSLPAAVAYMWEVLDKGHRLEWGEGFTLDLQRRGTFGADACAAPMFSWVNKEHAFWTAKTTTSFVALLDNYERETGVAEVTTSEEKRELAEFLEALTSTDVMRFAFAFLKEKGKDPRCASLRTKSDFKNLLYDLWFAPYRRYRANDSSGFEHVFVGEVKRGKVIGLHNWVQFYLEELKGNIDYLGWTGRQDGDYSDDVNIVSVKFAWDDGDGVGSAEEKPMSTLLCGSTVEFEMAALTLAFLAGNQEGDNKLQLGSERLNIKCYPQQVKYGGPKIGTAYFEID